MNGWRSPKQRRSGLRRLDAELIVVKIINGVNASFEDFSFKVTGNPVSQPFDAADGVNNLSLIPGTYTVTEEHPGFGRDGSRQLHGRQHPSYRHVHHYQQWSRLVRASILFQKHSAPLRRGGALFATGLGLAQRAYRAAAKADQRNR